MGGWSRLPRLELPAPEQLLLQQAAWLGLTPDQLQQVDTCSDEATDQPGLPQVGVAGNRRSTLSACLTCISKYRFWFPSDCFPFLRLSICTSLLTAGRGEGGGLGALGGRAGVPRLPPLQHRHDGRVPAARGGSSSLQLQATITKSN